MSDQEEKVGFAMPPAILFKKTEKQSGRIVPASEIRGASIVYDLKKVTFPEFLIKEGEQQGKLIKEEDHWIDSDKTIYFQHPEGFEQYNCSLGWFVDCPYPQKGFPFPQSVYAMNFAKKVLKEDISLIKGFDKKTIVLFSILFFLLPNKSKIRIMTSFIDSYDRTVSDLLDNFLIDERTFAPVAEELRKFLYNFLLGCGINPVSSWRFSEKLASLIQNDNAYYLRIEDIMSETNKSLLMENPAEEIKRLAQIFLKRDKAFLEEKFSRVISLISFVLKVSKFKKSFLSALDQSDFKNFQWDKSDKYHTLLWDDYDFRGKPIEERQEEYKAFHAEHPPFPPRRMLNYS